MTTKPTIIKATPDDIEALTKTIDLGTEWHPETCERIVNNTLEYFGVTDDPLIIQLLTTLVKEAREIADQWRDRAKLERDKRYATEKELDAVLEKYLNPLEKLERATMLVEKFREQANQLEGAK